MPICLHNALVVKQFNSVVCSLTATGFALVNQITLKLSLFVAKNGHNEKKNQNVRPVHAQWSSTENSVIS